MPILVESPYASIGAGIRTAGSALGSAIGEIGQQRRERKQKKEDEARAFQRRKQLGELQATEKATEREALSQEQLDRNRKLGAGVNEIVQKHRVNLDAGQELDTAALVGDVSAYAEKHGLNFNSLMESVGSVFDVEKKIASRQTAEEVKIERDIARERRFAAVADERNPDRTGKERDFYLELSEKFKNISNPVERARKTDVAYERIQDDLAKYTKAVALETPSLWERRVTGIPENKMKSLQARTKNLLKSGVKEKVLEGILTEAEFDEIQIEQIISPLSGLESKALNAIPKSVRTTPGALSAPFQRTQIQRQLENLPELLSKVIQDGGSVKLIAEELVRKGYTRPEISQALTELLELELTERQKSQIQAILIEPKRTRTLPQIFGNLIGR